MARLPVPRLAGPLVWNGTAAVVGQGATLVVAAILSNLLGPAEFARYAVAVSTVLTLGALAQSGLGFTATNFVARHHRQDPATMSRIARFCLQLGLVAGICCGIALALLSHQVALYVYGDASLWTILLAAGLTVPAASVGLVQLGIVTGMQRFVTLAASAGVFAACLLIGAIGGVILGGALGGAIGYGAATFARTAYLGWRIRPALAVPDDATRNPGLVRRQMLSFALAAGVAGLTLTPAIWGTNALLVNQYGLHELGLFSAAFTLKTLIAFVPTQFGAVFLPQYVATGTDDAGAAHRGLVRGILLIAAFSLMLASGVALLAGPIMRMFGPDFVAGRTMLRWLAASVVLECTVSIWAFRLAGEMRMWTSALVVTGPKDLLLVVMAFVLVPSYGGEGLAMAHLIAWTYAIGALAVLSLRGTPLPRAAA